MRKEFKLASVAGAIFMVSGSAFAALPGGDDASRFQDVMNGTGNPNMPSFCADATRCHKIIDGQGFTQIMVAGVDPNDPTKATGQVAGGIPSGEVYIYTFIGEGATTSDANYFRDISFVQMSQNTQGNATSGVSAVPGIYGRQTIEEADGLGGTFSAVTNLTVGSWAKEAGNTINDISLTQTLEDNANTNDRVGDDFKTTFDFASATETTNGVTKVSKTMDIGQWLGLQDGNSSTPLLMEVTAKDAQAFAYRSRSGSFNPTAGQATVGNKDGNNNLKYVTWDAGDQIAATWIGQTMVLPNAGAESIYGHADFAYLSYSNKSKLDNNLEFKIGFAKNDAMYNFDTTGGGLWKVELDGSTTPSTTYFGYEPCLASSSVTGGARTSVDPECNKSTAVHNVYP